MSKKKVQTYWAIKRSSDRDKYVAAISDDFISWVIDAADAFEFDSKTQAFGCINKHEKLSFGLDLPVKIRIYEG